MIQNGVVRSLPLERGRKEIQFSIEFEGRLNDGFEGKYICMWNHRKFTQLLLTGFKLWKYLCERSLKR